MKNDKKGFTLMEMLIVVAIIAVLVAIAIPVYQGAMEKSREAADAANLRAAYAKLVVRSIEGQDDLTLSMPNKQEGLYTEFVSITQLKKGWQYQTIEKIGPFFTTVEGANAAGYTDFTHGFKLIPDSVAPGFWTVCYTEPDDNFVIYPN